jgi:hypothetical protein
LFENEERKSEKKERTFLCTQIHFDSRLQIVLGNFEKRRNVNSARPHYTPDCPLNRFMHLCTWLTRMEGMMEKQQAKILELEQLMRPVPGPSRCHPW